MAKQVFKQALVEIKAGKDAVEWTDISDMVHGWDWSPRVGELQKFALHLVDCNDIKIRKGNAASDAELRVANADYVQRIGNNDSKGRRVATSDIIVINGVDISRWCSGYSHKAKVLEPDMILIYLQCDSDALRINGTHPWEYAPN